ncbi:MAG TPA: hypothetical protein VGR62_18090 [Candidatus Binatia bacterium]|jgi:hypothetical protein|nr:hypothetical protein [Candidatus Binatia bacterium]
MTSTQGVALALVGLLAMPAGADVLCHTKKGSVFVRAACKKRETPVELPVVPTGPAGDPGADAPAPTRIVDATGRPVGLFVEPGVEDNATIVVVEVGTHLVFVSVSRIGISGSSDPFLHVAADCSDQRLLAQSPTAFVRAGTSIGSTIYYADDPIETKPVAGREYLPTSGSCGGGTELANGYCCTEYTLDPPMVGPAAIAFEPSAFTPPFRLEP